MSISRCIHRATEFLKQNGRPLDTNLYLYYCENGSKDTAIQSLMEYQNPDGGFGRALEPDVRMHASSVLATTIAFQLMRPLHLSTEDSLVQRGMTYLLQTFNQDENGWSIVPTHVDQAPHAPWWTYKADIQHQWANPRAEILGYLYEYRSITSQALCERLLTDTLTRLANADSLEMHEVRCFVRLLESPNLPKRAAGRISDKLMAMLDKVVELNPDNWNAYCLTPLDIVSSLDSPLYTAFENVIPSNIEYIVRQQLPDGCWSPAWSWESTDRQAWQMALSELRSVITLRNLLRLRAHTV